MRFGRRDHESFIGGYDPEHEMPNPDRDPRDRWQSDVYRHNARDGRWAYRWSPDRFEDRADYGWSGGPRRMEQEIQPRDRYENRFSGMDRDRMSGYRGDYDRGWDYDRGGYGYGAPRDWDRGRDMERSMIDRYDRYDRYDRDRDRSELSGRDRDRGRDPWAARERFDREHFRNDWEWDGGYWDREGRYGRGGGNRY